MCNPLRIVASVCLIATACSQKTVVQTGLTGLHLQVGFGAAVGVDQLRISGNFADGSTAIPQNTLPSGAGAPLAADPSTDVLFSDAKAGQTVTIRVDGLAKGAVVGSEVGSGVLVAKNLVTVNITLGAAAVCGDGVLRAPLEACDDSNSTSGDGCSQSCVVEGGAKCPATAGPCAVGCGNGVVGAGESCDIFGATSPGCVGCLLVSGWTCTDSACHDNNCGNGTIEAGEKCDDGNVDAGDGCDANCQTEADWTCNTTATPSCCSKCGDNIVQCDEVCDGDQLTGATCLSSGHLTGASGAVSCNASCDGLDLSGCSTTLIDSTTRLQAAIQQAELEQASGPKLIRIAPGNYSVGNNPFLLGCYTSGTSNGCPLGQPSCTSHVCTTDGVILTPLSGVVSFSGATFTNKAEFEVSSPNNAFVNLSFVGQVAAIHLLPGADHTTIVENAFSRNDGQKLDMIFVESNENLIAENFFASKNVSLGTDASAGIHIDGGQNNLIAQNVFSGLFKTGIWVANQVSGVTVIDFNSMDMGSDTNTSTSRTGIYLDAVGGNGVCVRDNIIRGDTTTYAVGFNGTVTIGSTANCSGVTSGKNDVFGQASFCGPPSQSCIDQCQSTTFGPFCAQQVDPGFAATSLCLAATATTLIDAGDKLGYDKVPPDGAPLFNGTAPDIGARETGASYSFGNQVSTCP